MSTLIFILLVVNFLISAFNAWSLGRSWAEAKAAGGFARFMAWCVGTMSACGFTWCYLVVFCLVGQAIPGKYHLPDRYAQGIFDIGYLIIVLPIIGSGLAMTIQSWAYFWRERSFKNGAVAGYNTFAQIYNTWEAVRGIPEALSDLEKLWSTEDEDDVGKGKLIFMLFLVALLCLIGGILTATAIVRVVARGEAREQLYRLRGARV